MDEVINFQPKEKQVQRTLDYIEINKRDIKFANVNSTRMPSGDEETIVTIVIRKIFRGNKIK